MEAGYALSPEYNMWRKLFAISDALKEAIIRKYLQSGRDVSLRHHIIMKKVCEMMEKTPEGIPLKDLAAALHLTPGTVSELVESLVHKNALRRVQNPNDRRAVMITVTEKSLKALHEAEAKISEYAGMIWRNFTENEKKTLLGLLDRMSRNLDYLR